MSLKILIVIMMKFVRRRKSIVFYSRVMVTAYSDNDSTSLHFVSNSYHYAPVG
jgi:hypothetical protein